MSTTSETPTEPLDTLCQASSEVNLLLRPQARNPVIASIRSNTSETPAEPLDTLGQARQEVNILVLPKARNPLVATIRAVKVEDAPEGRSAFIGPMLGAQDGVESAAGAWLVEAWK